MPTAAPFQLVHEQTRSGTKGTRFGFTSFVAIFLDPAKMFFHPSKEVEILGPEEKNSLGNVTTRTE